MQSRILPLLPFWFPSQEQSSKKSSRELLQNPEHLLSMNNTVHSLQLLESMGPVGEELPFKRELKGREYSRGLLLS